MVRGAGITEWHLIQGRLLLRTRFRARRLVACLGMRSGSCWLFPNLTSWPPEAAQVVQPLSRPCTAPCPLRNLPGVCPGRCLRMGVQGRGFRGGGRDLRGEPPPERTKPPKTCKELLKNDSGNGRCDTQRSLGAIFPPENIDWGIVGSQKSGGVSVSPPPLSPCMPCPLSVLHGVFIRH